MAAQRRAAAHGRESALQLTDRIAVKGRVGEHPQLTVDGVGDLVAVCLFGEEFGEVLTEMVEHGRHQSVLGAEVPVDQSVVDPRSRGDIADDVAANPRSANRSAAECKTAATTSSLPTGAAARVNWRLREP